MGAAVFWLYIAFRIKGFWLPTFIMSLWLFLGPLANEEYRSNIVLNKKIEDVIGGGDWLCSRNEKMER